MTEQTKTEKMPRGKKTVQPNPVETQVATPTEIFAEKPLIESPPDPIRIAGTWIYLKGESRLLNVGVGCIAVIEIHGGPKAPDRKIQICSVSNGSQSRHQLPPEMWHRALAGMDIVNRDDMPKEE